MVEGNQVGVSWLAARLARNTLTALWVGATTVQHNPAASAWARKRIDKKVLPVPAWPLSRKGLPSAALSQLAKASSAPC